MPSIDTHLWSSNTQVQLRTRFSGYRWGSSDVAGQTGPVFTANLADGKLRATFNEAVLDTSALRTVGNYTIAVPSGAPTVSVSAIHVTTNYVDLTLSQAELVNGLSYAVSLAKATAHSATTGLGNDPMSAVFMGISTPAAVVSVLPRDRALRVVFSRNVNMATALVVGNYSITGGGNPLAIQRVDQVNSYTVDVVTDPQQAITYILTISGVKDLVGNEVTGG